MNGLTVSIEQRGDAVIAVLQGPADMSTLDGLDQALDAVLDRKPHAVVIDLGAVTYMNSLTIGALVRAYQTLKRAGGELRLANPSPYAAKILASTHIRQALPTYDTLDGALAGGEAGASGAGGART